MTAPLSFAAQGQALGALADAAIAAAATASAALTTQLQAAQTALLAAQATDTTDQAEIAALEAQIATVTQQLAALQTPPVVTPPPATGTVFVDNDFSGSGALATVIAPLVMDGSPQMSVVPSPDGSGKKVLAFPGGAVDTINQILYKFANNAALTTRHAGGIFAAFDIGYDANALANLAASRGGQYKHWLSRYLDWNSTPGAVNSAGPGGLMGGVGPAFYGEGGVVPGQLTVIDDANTSTIPQSATGVIFKPNVMQRVQYWFSRDPVAKIGRGRMWAWNSATGQYDLKVDFSSPNMFRDTDGTYDRLYLQLGNPYSTGAPGTAFLGHVKVADFQLPN